MSNLELTALPESFPAGTTVSYLKTFAGYGPGDGWALTLYLRGSGTLDKTATTESGAFRVTLSAIETADLGAGSYQWEERLTKAGNVLVGAGGTVIVTPDLVDAAGGDLQTWAEKTLALVELAIEQRIPSGMESYQIAGRAISKIPVEKLVMLRAQLAAMVAREQNPIQTSRPIHVKFTPIE